MREYSEQITYREDTCTLLWLKNMGMNFPSFEGQLVTTSVCANPRLRATSVCANPSLRANHGANPRLHASRMLMLVGFQL